MAIRRIAAGSLVVSCGVKPEDVARIPGYDTSMLTTHDGVLASRIRSGLTCVIPAASVQHATSVLEKAQTESKPGLVLAGSVNAAKQLEKDFPNSEILVTENHIEFIGDTNDITHLSGVKVLISDVHNSWRTLNEMVTTAVETHGEDVLLISVGDLFNKGGRDVGTAAINMIETVSELVETGRMIAIKGNHEHQICKLLRDGSEAKGVSRRTVDAIRTAENADSLIAKAVSLIDPMPLWLRVDETTIATHAGWRPELQKDQAAGSRRRFQETCLWGGRGSWQDEYQGEDLVVVGHVTKEEPTLEGNILHIDTGLHTGGTLTGYVAGSNPIEKTSYISISLHRKDRKQELLAV